MNCLMEEEEIRLIEVRRRLKRRKSSYLINPPRNDFQLHEEIMLNIISRLPVESVLMCRLVCKTWRNLPLLGRDNNSYFADMHLRHLLKQCHLHHHHQNKNSNSDSDTKFSFVFLGRSKSLYYLEYDENDVKSYQKHKSIKFPLPPDTNSGSLVGSCNGLICLAVRSQPYCYDPAYIYNPITRELVHLPRFIMNNKHKYYSSIAHGFGYHPSTKEYKVVRIYYCLDQRPSIGQVQVYTLGSGIGWRNKGELTHLLESGTSSLAVLLNGALHWLTMDGNIVAFDLADEKFCSIPTPPCSTPHWYLYSSLWLLGGWLCVVHQTKHYSADIRLLKKNKNEEKHNMSRDDDNMKAQDHQSWSWSREFTISVKDIYPMYLQPFVITKRSEILSWYEGKSILCCASKTAEKQKWLGHLDEAINGWHVIPHFNSFVSLKALGENAKIL